ncbi:FAD-dependent oxidoreductase [Tychonema sp. LEGE 07199]|uniref:flavin monoamine oxidase family protein n=1 Tax=unclassified Tychonema TaxID=2642144 RepID=UPI001882F534|nr:MULTISPECIES: NAD(P)/FAD-dependent oxidoreductase [unclassified Tychonema]MBE9121864.1 FAD-dependent oxidoreductase [Tychonema sp. LEGE 07199]MBE9134167.1 FAD-dependent oxidoreductase [Tychonema sp. LEGE 07196]
MSFRTNIQDKPLPQADWVAWPYIDTLYDYVDFITKNPQIATLPKKLWDTEVAIVGAGVAGLVAAYELLKIGVKPVIFEATDRIGGRAYSLKFKNSEAFAEMGSMRFPPSGKLLFYYFKLFDLNCDGQFPDPGKVLTKLYYENTIINWPPGEDTPQDIDFKRIGQDWSDFVRGLVQPLYDVWQKQQWDEVKIIWQHYINKYKDISFYDGVRRGLPKWSDEDMNKFGALGIGSGGFGPLYQVSFLEILRIIVNMWEDNQQFLPGGISQVTDKFYTQPVTKPDGTKQSLKGINAVSLSTPVTAIEYMKGEPIVYYVENGQQKYKRFQAAIVATSTRAMEMIGMTLSSPPKSVVEQSVEVAIRNLHLMDSSKMFVLTEKKFWKDDPKHIPQNIQTDELPRGVYALDYPKIDNGVVLISYTWGDDSSKLLGLPDKMRRFELFRQAIAQVSPEFANNLVPLNNDPDCILNIDWEAQPYAYGAFKLQYPGQEPSIHAAYYQFLSALSPESDRGLYLAGDSVSWSGGWTEGALHTGINAACAVAKRIGANLSSESPLSQDPNLYDYGQR